MITATNVTRCVMNRQLPVHAHNIISHRNFRDRENSGVLSVGAAGSMLVRLSFFKRIQRMCYSATLLLFAGSSSSSCLSRKLIRRGSY